MSSQPLHRLLACRGCGSAIVEAAFAHAGIALEIEAVDYAPGSPTRDRLLEVNPLGQVPALVLSDARVLTETLAILHYVDELEPGANLIPPRGDPTRTTFYRWSVFVVAAIYPTFTYGDDPAKWVANEEGAKQLRASTDKHRQNLWRQMEAAAGAPWFLGGRMSALDLYVAVMTRWRPGLLWFAKNAPRLTAIARETAALDAIAPVMQRNFD